VWKEPLCSDATVLKYLQAWGLIAAHKTETGQAFAAASMPSGGRATLKHLAAIHKQVRLVLAVARRSTGSHRG